MTSTIATTTTTPAPVKTTLTAADLKPNALVMYKGREARVVSVNAAGDRVTLKPAGYVRHPFTWTAPISMIRPYQSEELWRYRTHAWVCIHCGRRNSTRDDQEGVCGNPRCGRPEEASWHD